MTIKKDLPFEFCENCEKFVVDASEEQVLFGDNQLVHKVLYIRCNNAWLCRQLKKNMCEDESDD